MKKNIAILTIAVIAATGCSSFTGGSSTDLTMKTVGPAHPLNLNAPIINAQSIVNNMSMEVVGQGYYLQGATIKLLTSGTVLAINPTNLSVNADDKILSFKITDATKMCDQKKCLDYSRINIGDPVTVLSPLVTQSSEAASIRKGFAWTGGPSQFLTEGGSDCGCGDASSYSTGIFDAVRAVDLDQTTLVLKNYPDLINARDNFGYTPLHAAASVGSVELVLVLLQCNPDINAKDNYGETPLHLAVFSGQQKIVDLLRRHGGKE